MSMTVLSENLVVQKAKVENLAHVRSLNVWGMELADVTVLKQLPNLQVCSLSVNRIDSLAVFAACPHLQELYLRRNRVADLRELYHLQGCRRLRSLWLGENPVAAHPGYRLFAVKLLKGLTKLDDADITREERAQAERLTEMQLLAGHLTPDPAPQHRPRVVQNGAPAPRRHADPHGSPPPSPRAGDGGHALAQRAMLESILSLLPHLDHRALAVCAREVAQLRGARMGRP